MKSGKQCGVVERRCPMTLRGRSQSEAPARSGLGLGAPQVSLRRAGERQLVVSLVCFLLLYAGRTPPWDSGAELTPSEFCLCGKRARTRTSLWSSGSERRNSRATTCQDFRLFFPALGKLVTGSEGRGSSSRVVAMARVLARNVCTGLLSAQRATGGGQMEAPRGEAVWGAAQGTSGSSVGAGQAAGRCWQNVHLFGSRISEGVSPFHIALVHVDDHQTPGCPDWRVGPHEAVARGRDGSSPAGFWEREAGEAACPGGRPLGSLTKRVAWSPSLGNPLGCCPGAGAGRWASRGPSGALNFTGLSAWHCRE